MNKKLSMSKLKHFKRPFQVFWHSSGQIYYTKGVRNWVNETTGNYYLIDDIAFIVLPRLLTENEDWFYLLEILVNSNQSMFIMISDSKGNICLKSPIHFANFSILKKPIKLYLCSSNKHYCLMLPNEC